MVAYLVVIPRSGESALTPRMGKHALLVVPADRVGSLLAFLMRLHVAPPARKVHHLLLVGELRWLGVGALRQSCLRLLESLLAHLLLRAKCRRRVGPAPLGVVLDQDVADLLSELHWHRIESYFLVTNELACAPDIHLLGDELFYCQLLPCLLRLDLLLGSQEVFRDLFRAQIVALCDHNGELVSASNIDDPPEIKVRI